MEALTNSCATAHSMRETFLIGAAFRLSGRNQFGAAAGGPIKKDRTFVFGDFEAIRQSKGITQVSVVPSSNARKGILSGGTPLVGPCPFANSTNLAPGQASVCVDNTVQKFLGLYPLANGPISPSGDTGEFAFAGQQVVSEYFFTIRVDHKISVNVTLSASYMYDDTGFTFPDNFDDLRKGHHTNRQLAALEETHIFTPTLVNTARVGLNPDWHTLRIGRERHQSACGGPVAGCRSRAKRTPSKCKWPLQRVRRRVEFANARILLLEFVSGL